MGFLRFSKPIVVMLVVCSVASESFAQYPVWFIEQGRIPGPRVVVGYAQPGYRHDSTGGAAYQDALFSFARQNRVKISGGQIFWNTEAGSFWMGSDFSEDVDTTGLTQAAESLAVLDSFTTPSMQALLLGPKGSELDPAWKTMTGLGTTAPGWIESPPVSSTDEYAVGMAPQYYYESSSWKEAERMARRNLARSVFTTVRMLQKSGIQAQGIEHEELRVDLHDISVAARWRDVNARIVYVLMRTPK